MSYLTAGMLILIGIAGYVLAQYSEVNRKLPTVSDIEPFLDQCLAPRFLDPMEC